MKVRITPPEGAAYEVELPPEGAVLGRGEGCTVTLDERTVSRRHVSLQTDPSGTLVVKDLGSRYGTRINGRPVTEPAPLFIGDVLEVGGFLVEFPGSSDTDPAVPTGPGEHLETRRLKKDTHRSQPAIRLPEPRPPSAGARRALSWLWVVLLLAGLLLLGWLLVDYLSGGSPAPGGDAALHAPSPEGSPAAGEVAPCPSCPRSS
ncbi:MAG: FHA domain-containing protein [Deltaproteobacteria bacterium]|nr:FHA domain-containing protein [Deltaproteobacteria bacterium]